MHAADAAAHLLGIEVERVEPGGALVRMTARPEVLNGLGMLHGGALFTLADTAMGHASNSHGLDAVAVAASIDFLAPVAEGTVLTAHAVERHRHGRLALYEVTVSDGEGVVVAVFHGRTQVRRTAEGGAADGP